MRLFLIFIPFVLAAVAATSELRDVPPFNQLPGGYIVEFDTSTSLHKRGINVHTEFLRELDKRSAGKFTTRHTFDSPIFNGISVQLHSEQDLVSLADLPHVVSVHPISLVPRPTSTVDRSVSTIDLDDPSKIPDGQSAHYMTGVDKAHAAGFTGKGIKIAVIDFGIDYTHPSLGGKLGPGNKVAGGYDFVGDDYNGSNTPKPDNDPNDCDGHGTHVAGIIAANPGNPWNMSGVAYDASLYAYRIFGCKGYTSDDLVVAALLRAHTDGADIITGSISDANGWGSKWASMIASGIAREGRVVTIAAGNYGDAGAFFSGTPAAGQDVISVGSVNNIRLPHPYLVSSKSDKKIVYELASSRWFPVIGKTLNVGDKPLPLYALSRDPHARDVGCTPFGDAVPDLATYAVLVSANFTQTSETTTSNCTWIEQTKNLMAKNAKVVLYFDVTDPFMEVHDFAGAILSNHDDAVSLLDQLAQDPKLTVSIPHLTQSGSGTTDLPTVAGGLLSDFSAWGPSNELYFKPALVAPGGNILSTFPPKLGSWLVKSGTSMSTPYVAGCAALVLQAKGKQAARDMRDILQSSSVAVPVSKNPGALPLSLAGQGSGLVDVFSALTTKTTVFPAQFVLNDTAHHDWQGSHSFTIQNNALSAQTYQLAHQAAGTAVTVASGKNDFNVYPVPIIDAPAIVTLSTSNVTIQPGRSVEVSVSIQPPNNVDVKTLPIVSGWITIRGDLGDLVKVSYMGVAGSVRDAQTISTGNALIVPSDGGLPALISGDVDAWDVHAQRGLKSYNIGAADWPTFYFSLATPSRRVTVDLVPADTSIRPTVPSPFPSGGTPTRRAWSSWWPGLRTAQLASDSYSQVPVLGLISEQLNLPRSGDSRNGPWPWLSLPFPTKFANGTTIPLGQYRLLLRALRWFGEVQNEADYDVYLSEPVDVLAATNATVPQLA